MTTASYPYLRIHFSVGTHRDHVPALVDTGFDGYLAVPEDLLERLPSPARLEPVRTASREVLWVPAYPGTLELDQVPGRFQALVLCLGDEYLLGLTAINRYLVTFDHGLRVTVEL